jgi:hypothetical protein
MEFEKIYKYDCPIDFALSLSAGNGNILLFGILEWALRGLLNWKSYYLALVEKFLSNN